MLSHCMPLLVLCVGPRKPVTFWVTGNGFDRMVGSCHKVTSHWSGSPAWGRSSRDGLKRTCLKVLPRCLDVQRACMSSACALLHIVKCACVLT